MRLDSFKTRLVVMFAALFIFGIVFTVKGISENSKAEKATDDFNYMTKSEFADGMYVKGRVYEIMGEFAVEETHNKTLGITTSKRISSHYYVVPMVGTFESDTPMYIAVEISHVDRVADAEKLMEQTWKYYDEGIEPTVWNEFDIQGKVTALDDELTDYLYEWFMYGDVGATRADYAPYICPYVVTYVNTSGNGNIFSIIMGAIGAIGLTVIIMLHLRGNTAPQLNTNQGYTYTSGDSVPPYSPNAAEDLTDRGFPPPAPSPAVKQDGPDIDDFFNNGEKHRIPTADNSNENGGEIPSVSREMFAAAPADTGSTDSSEEEEEEKDWWGD
ncbi:MAG: hypothetical protein IJ416_09705 [Ruminiclostridium sp.]|nr:hypothetical protein [Ruminiclostridium sp.]